MKNKQINLECFYEKNVFLWYTITDVALRVTNVNVIWQEIRSKLDFK